MPKPTIAFSRWLAKVQNGPITITRRGKPVGVIISPDEYRRLRRVQAYLQRRFDRSAYDAAYPALAEARGDLLVTGDLRLYNAVRSHLDWVHWIEDWQASQLSRGR